MKQNMTVPPNTSALIRMGKKNLLYLSKKRERYEAWKSIHLAHPAIPLPITTTSASSCSMPVEVASCLVLTFCRLLNGIACLLGKASVSPPPPMARGTGTTNASAAPHQDGALKIARVHPISRIMLELVQCSAELDKGNRLLLFSDQGGRIPPPPLHTNEGKGEPENAKNWNCELLKIYVQGVRFTP